MKPEILTELATALELYFNAIPLQKEPNPPALLPLIKNLGELQTKYHNDLELNSVILCNAKATKKRSSKSANSNHNPV